MPIESYVASVRNHLVDEVLFNRTSAITSYYNIFVLGPFDEDIFC